MPASHGLRHPADRRAVATVLVAVALLGAAQFTALPGRFTNWLLFNNGYHSAHHLEPELHWSDVPRLHERIADRIPARLHERSAIRYMLRRYLFARSA